MLTLIAAIAVFLIGFLSALCAARQAIEAANYEAQRAQREALELRREPDALAAENARLQALIAEMQALLAVHRQLHRQQAALAIARGQAGYVAPAVFLN